MGRRKGPVLRFSAPPDHDGYGAPVVSLCRRRCEAPVKRGWSGVQSLRFLLAPMLDRIVRKVKDGGGGDPNHKAQ